MSSTTPTTNPPARTHAEAAAIFRRPFAPGAIGFRAMTKVPHKGEPYAGAQVAAYLGAQSVVKRLNAVAPGRWRQQFQSVPAELVPGGTRRIYLACRLIVTLPAEEGGADVEVQAIRRHGESDLLVLSSETEQWLRHGYQTRMSTEAVRRDLGEILAHGEPETGIGQGEVADQAAQSSEPPATEPAGPATNGHGEVVTVDFGDLGPAAA
jgi:hypothetical protein